MTHDWLAWPGWTFAGTVAQVLSLVAILFAIREINERRRAYPAVDLNLDLIGTADDGAGNTWHVAELTNAGSGTAVLHSITLVDAKLVKSPSEAIKWTLPTGRPSRLEFSTADLNEAWALLLYSSHSDRRFLIAEWCAIKGSGPMFEAEMTSWENTPRRRWYQRRKVSAVGPGGVARTLMRVGTKGNDTDAALALVPDFKTGRANAYRAGAR
jgi:hypothetical protein